MYELINCTGTYHQLPDNMTKLHPFIMDTSHIKSAIDRAYMAVLVDARGHRNEHYNIDDDDDDDDSDESTVYLDEGDMQPAYSEIVRENSQSKYRYDQWFSRVVLDHHLMKEVIQYLIVLIPFDMGFCHTIASH